MKKIKLSVMGPNPKLREQLITALGSKKIDAYKDAMLYGLGTNITTIESDDEWHFIVEEISEKEIFKDQRWRYIQGSFAILFVYDTEDEQAGCARILKELEISIAKAKGQPGKITDIYFIRWGESQPYLLPIVRKQRCIIDGSSRFIFFDLLPMPIKFAILNSSNALLLLNTIKRDLNQKFGIETSNKSNEQIKEKYDPADFYKLWNKR